MTETHLGNACVRWENGLLTVDTGKFSRSWRFGEHGFATEAITAGGRELCTGTGACDYDLFGLTGRAKCHLATVDCYPIEDEYTSPRLEAVAVTDYPDLMLCVKFVVWVYPDACGVRTQLFVKRYVGCEAPAQEGDSVVESLLLPKATKVMDFFGYNNDTQHRNLPELDLIREEALPLQDGSVDWANGILLDAGGEGLCMVKESNKCVNQPAYDTGAFLVRDGRLLCTGAGLRAEDLTDTEYLFAWAAWTLFYTGGELGAQQAVKSFDRLRFPVDEDRDLYIMSNTWGSSGLPMSPVARDVANEESILKELDVAHELGVEVLQVDDGWNAPYNEEDRRVSDRVWAINRDKFPRGWAPIREKAREYGIKMGLWCAWYATGDEMLENQRQGDFRYFKIDFAHLDTRPKFQYLYNKALRLTQSGKVRVNWDVTENEIRMGYYFGREFGNIYLANRKPNRPLNVIYEPYLVLRDAWQLSKYTNINKFQITLQNPELTDPERSDAYLHNLRYCTMIACVGAPILFQELKYLSEKARAAIKETLAVYKKYRRELFAACVCPTGDKPDNASWTGFQFITDGESGHMMVFRERLNGESRRKIKFHGLANKTLQIEDIFEGTVSRLTTDDTGMAELTVESPCTVRWLRYTVK